MRQRSRKKVRKYALEHAIDQEKSKIKEKTLKKKVRLNLTFFLGRYCGRNIFFYKFPPLNIYSPRRKEILTFFPTRLWRLQLKIILI